MICQYLKIAIRDHPYCFTEEKLLVLAVPTYADVVELVDTHALGACALQREGSSPFIRTKVKDQACPGYLLW